MAYPQQLPVRLNDRVDGASYEFNGSIRMWKANKLLCEHGLGPLQCEDCIEHIRCVPHGKVRKYCVPCEHVHRVNQLAIAYSVHSTV